MALAHSIPATGTVKYNGYTFPPFIKARIQGVPTYNNAETAVKYITYTLTIETIVTYLDDPTAALLATTDVVGPATFPARSNVGMNVDNLRKRLQKRGQELIFTQQGFGEFFINRETGTALTAATAYNAVTDAIDVKMGPKPRLLVLEPIGANQAWRLVWTCEFTIPECSQALYQQALAESSFESHFAINEEGMSTRTIRGTLEIAATLTSDNVIKDTVDAYLVKFLPALPAGFHRESTRNISRDKRTCDFTIQDTEIPSDNVFFPYMVQISLSHRVSSDLMTYGFVRWPQTISGTIRWRAGVSPLMAFLAFGNFVLSRLAYAKNVNPSIKDPLYDQDYNRQGRNIPMSIDITENIYDRELSISYSYVGLITVDTLFAGTGLFQPITGLTWEGWHTSLSEHPGAPIAGIQAPTGFAGMRDYGNLDEARITGLCENFTQNPGIPNNIVYKFTPSLTYNIFVPSCQDYNQVNSWLHWEPPHVERLLKTDIADQFPRSGSSTGETTPRQPTETTSQSSSDNSNQVVNSSIPSQQRPTRQQKGHNRYAIQVSGHAARLCYKPPIPTFASLGNVPLTLRDSWEKRTAVPAGKLTIYKVQWWKLYTYDEPVVGNLETLLVPGTDATSADK